MSSNRNSYDFTLRDESYGNTVLHTAIINSDATTALDILNTQGVNSIINVKALGNTALILAIKRGMIDVALQISNNTIADLNSRDSKGFTALHWACMLKQDALIQKLLVNGATISEGTMISVTPTDLYRDNTNYSTTFTAYANNRHSRFSEGPDDRIYVSSNRIAACYSDLIFHTRELCINLDRCASSHLANGSNWSGNTQFVTFGENNYNRTEDVFCTNLLRGATAFFSARNQITISHDVLQLLTSSSNQSREDSATSSLQQNNGDEKKASDETTVKKDQAPSPKKTLSCFFNSLDIFQKSKKDKDDDDRSFTQPVPKQP